MSVLLVTACVRAYVLCGWGLVDACRRAIRLDSEPECDRVCVVMRLWMDLHFWLQLVPACATPGRGYLCVFLQRDGWTPFRIAQRKGHADVAAVLAEGGGR